MIGKAIGLATAPAIGAAIGSVAGAAWGGNTPGADANSMSTAGMVAGAGLGIGVSAMAAFPKATAKGAMGLASTAGAAALSATEAVGGAAIAGAELTGSMAMGASKIATPVAAYAAGKYSSIAAGVGSKLVKPDLKSESNMLGHKMTGLGTGLVFGSAVVSGAVGAFNDFNRTRMGQSDGQITRATPRTPSYANNAGATGDLVFAMNRNRRG